MKKHLLLIIAAVCLLPVYLFAEAIPEGYYADIEGKSDSILKSTLSLICRGGERYEYGPNQFHSTNDPEGRWKKGDFKAYGTWQALPQTDMHPDGIIWDMYSNCVRYYPNKQGESGCSLNIEHCLPKSWWGWWSKSASDQDPREDSWRAYKDLYNLNPSDAQANSQKSNYAPGHIAEGKADKFDNGSFRMAKAATSDYGYICFEPAPEYRGDFARAYFYVATAYGFLEWGANYTDYVNTNNYLVFSDKIQKVLLDWNESDPVSDKEICRADIISSIQHNRNPFIDYPELVDYIWGDKKGQPVSLASLKCTYGTGTCHEYVPSTDTEHKYDTLLNFPALTKSIVNETPNCFTSEKIQSNGTASITMGASTTDAWLSFSKLNLQDTAVLAFRASIYNTAESMQLDIYTGNTLLKSITDEAVKNTRNEIRYRVTIPAGTDSITIKSEGGKTTKRACMQELYLLSPKKQDQTGINTPEARRSSVEKFIRNGKLFIKVDDRTYSILGQ